MIARVRRPCLIFSSPPSPVSPFSWCLVHRECMFGFHHDIRIINNAIGESVCPWISYENRVRMYRRKRREGEVPLLYKVDCPALNLRPDVLRAPCLSYTRVPPACILVQIRPKNLLCWYPKISIALTNETRRDEIGQRKMQQLRRIFHSERYLIDK